MNYPAEMAALLGENRPAHSILGASSAERWFECSASVAHNLGKKSVSSQAADDGTQAHLYKQQLQEGKITESQIPEEDEMRESVLTAVDVVRTLYAKAKYNGGFHLLEHQFDLSAIYPGCFGTCDDVVYDPKLKILYVIDFKHGRGVLVSPFENKQLMYYGLGALTTVPGLGDVEKVILIIVQPRCFHQDGPVRSWETDPLTIFDFALELQERAEATKNGVFKPGDHCQFCPGDYDCPALRHRAMVEAKEVFGVIPSQTGEIPLPATVGELAKALEWAPTLKNWIKAIDRHAYITAIKGIPIPGFKLVEKRATRKWVDEERAIEVLKSGGMKDSEILEVPSLKSPAQIEKLLPKSDRKVVDMLVEKKSSGCALVAEHDKRPAVVAGPDAVFEEIPDDED